MPKLHVIAHKDELDPLRLADKLVAVIDVLFATSTVVAVLDAGALEVIPVVDAQAARARAREFPAGEVVLAGERDTELIPGFSPFSPRALASAGVAGKRVIYSTTNGTVALVRAAGAALVCAAALRNAAAAARVLAGQSAGRTALLVCAGSAARFNLEDFYGAGALADRLLAETPGHWELSDAALAAQAAFAARTPLECLRASRIGRRLAAAGAGHELRYCAELDGSSVVPVLRDGRLRGAQR